MYFTVHNNIHCVHAVLQDAYSNPIAPPDGDVREQRNLSNDDFRKLMMTPRTTSTSSLGSVTKETTTASSSSSSKKTAPRKAR